MKQFSEAQIALLIEICASADAQAIAKRDGESDMLNDIQNALNVMLDGFSKIA